MISLLFEDIYDLSKAQIENEFENPCNMTASQTQISHLWETDRPAEASYVQEKTSRND